MSADAPLHTVVVNAEGQYSIWPLHREVPEGWAEIGVRGIQEDCLAHIGRVWIDLRPVSLRRAMEEFECPPRSPSRLLARQDTPTLAHRLASGRRRVEVPATAADPTGYLRSRLQAGYLRVLFPDTQGGTEIGLAIDDRSRQEALAAIETNGDILLHGLLHLDETPVVCQVRLRLPELTGEAEVRFLPGSGSPDPRPASPLPHD